MSELAELVQETDFENAWERWKIDPVSLWLYYKQCHFFSINKYGRGKLNGPDCWWVVCRLVENESEGHVDPRRLY